MTVMTLDPALKSISPTSTSSCIHPALVQAEPYVNATHMELFYFIIDGADWTTGGDHLKGSRPHIAKYAFTHPFLLNELLAVSALHLSTRRPAQQSFYRDEATRLQSQGLRLFNETTRDLNNENIIPAFLFSALQGIVTFFETFHDPTYEASDYTTFFDNVVQSVRLLQGVRAIVAPWWQFLLASEIKDILDVDEDRTVNLDWADEVVDRFESIRAHISQSPELNPAQAVVCDKAIEELIYVYRAAFAHGREPTPEEQAAAQHSTRWLILVPPGYTELLVQRKPEALVILGYFAILLHRLRDCWNVGDAAERLLLVVEAHLEEPWLGALSWPNVFVESHLIS
jgi:hypothetical protein